VNIIDVITKERGVGFTEECGTGTYLSVTVIKRSGKPNKM